MKKNRADSPPPPPPGSCHKEVSCSVLQVQTLISLAITHMSLCGSFRKPPEVIWDKSLLLKGKSASADGEAKGCREFTRAL